MRKILTNRARQEQDHDHSRSDPDRPVKIWVPLEHIEEVGARVDSRGATAQDLGGINVEGLGVEGECPEQVLAVAACGRGRGAGEEGGRVWLDLCAARGVGFEGWECQSRCVEGASRKCVLELWNSRSSCRSVWPRSPWGV